MTTPFDDFQAATGPQGKHSWKWFKALWMECTSGHPVIVPDLPGRVTTGNRSCTEAGCLGWMPRPRTEAIEPLIETLAAMWPYKSAMEPEVTYRGGTWTVKYLDGVGQANNFVDALCAALLTLPEWKETP